MVKYLPKSVKAIEQNTCSYSLAITHNHVHTILVKYTIGTQLHTHTTWLSPSNNPSAKTITERIIVSVGEEGNMDHTQ